MTRFVPIFLLVLVLMGAPHVFADTNVPTGSASSQSVVTGSQNSQNVVTGSNQGLQNPLKDDDLVTLLHDLLQFVITIGGIAVVLMLVYCGFLFIKAQGKPEEIQNARNMLLWTVVGALLILGATAIQSGIQATVQSLSS